MVKLPIRIGTRESQLAVWQATTVKDLLQQYGYPSKLVFIKSEGDTNLQTPLYEMGVQGIFTKALDIALLNKEIDIAVHSMKDVPTVLAKGVVQAATLPRASYRDILIPKTDASFLGNGSNAVIATSSIRRKAQWLNRYPEHTIEDIRGNVNTRLRKVLENNWHGAIFAAAGLERIGLRPENAVELDWMLPAPAQGAIIVVCREGETVYLDACNHFNDTETVLCTAIERDFLRALLGGCATPISALAQVVGDKVSFRGNILSTDGARKKEVSLSLPIDEAQKMGIIAAEQLLQDSGQEILDKVRNGK